MKIISKAVAAIACIWATAAPAEQTFLTGHISNVTFGAGTISVMLDTGVPGNCTGIPYGWMLVPPSEKAMQAFVIGLWMRGDAAQTSVTIYTGGLVNGNCEITQLDPVN